MELISDFQIHSRFSYATSKKITIKSLAENAEIKGLKLMGTGDFTHPIWIKELKNNIKPVEDSNLFKLKNTYFMLTGEISTIYQDGIKCRKVHHMIHAPSFDVVEQITEVLSKYGKLKRDGRPIVKISSAQFVEEMMEIDKRIFIYPAHIWTPWFGALGSKSGYDSIEECYKDQTKHIHAIETGLSSDPPMNWCVSSLDKFTLLSSSDAHSANPLRIGREANVFDLKKITYNEIHNVIKKKDNKKFKFTIEVDPNYGKYHYDGCSNCNVSSNPEETIKNGNLCPNCGKGMTIGVLNRVKKLTDRKENYVPKKSINFKRVIPLYEIIAFSLGVKNPNSKKVSSEYMKMIQEFGNEFNIIFNIKKEKLDKFNMKISNSIMKLRKGKVKFKAGYDGKYGVPVF